MVSLFIVYVIDISVNLYCVHTNIIKTSWRYSDLISRSIFIITSYFTLFILTFLYSLNCVVVQALQHVIRLVTYRCQEHRHIIISNILNWIFLYEHAFISFVFPLLL